jgi:gustatory receptor
MENISAIVAVQIFGMFPYRNMFSPNVSRMTFKWSSARVLYSSLLLVYAIVAALLNTYRQFLGGSIKPSRFDGVVFDASSALYCIFFHSIDWKAFMVQFGRVESRFFNENYKHAPSSRTLQQRIGVCISMGLAATLLNQVLFYMAQSQKVMYITSECQWTNHNILQDFIVDHLDHIFDWIPYNHVFGLIAEVGNIGITFYWGFADIFIMLVSIGVAFRFQQINNRLDFFKGRIISIDRWNELRLDYVEVCELLKFVDGVLDKLILIATLSNSYLILVQLLNMFA